MTAWAAEQGSIQRQRPRMIAYYWEGLRVARSVFRREDHAAVLGIDEQERDRLHVVDDDHAEEDR
jgi:hypothetical protein